MLNDPDEAERAAIGIAEIEVNERMGMAADSVPKPYLDASARLQCQKPMQASDHTWSSLALEFDWTTGDLFDVPRDGSPGGLGLVSGWRDGLRYGKREEFLERR